MFYPILLHDIIVTSLHDCLAPGNYSDCQSVSQSVWLADYLTAAYLSQPNPVSPMICRSDCLIAA